MDKNEISKIMKLIVWDYDIDPYKLYEVVMGKYERVGHFDAERILVRMIERLSWYDLIDILGYDFLKKNLSKKNIDKVRHKDVRERYEFIRRFLQGEAVSFSGWSSEYRERIKHTLLSNRWYRAQQVLF